MCRELHSINVLLDSQYYESYYSVSKLSLSNLDGFETLRGCSYGGELARSGGLARLDEMIFIPRSYGMFYLSSIKKFVMSLEKDCLK